MVHKKKVADWQPLPSDIQWTLNLVRSLKVGGTWGTSFARFKKVSENEFVLEDVNHDPFEMAEENIEKVEKVFSIIGVKLDRRGK